jgi:hypothetical protein
VDDDERRAAGETTDRIGHAIEAGALLSRLAFQVHDGLNIRKHRRRRLSRWSGPIVTGESSLASAVVVVHHRSGFNNGATSSTFAAAQMWQVTTSPQPPLEPAGELATRKQHPGHHRLASSSAIDAFSQQFNPLALAARLPSDP